MEFLPKVYLVGNYGDFITKEHLSRQPLHLTSVGGNVGDGGSLQSLVDEFEEVVDGHPSSGQKTAAGLLKNRTVAKAFDILMEAKPTRQTE